MTPVAAVDFTDFALLAAVGLFGLAGWLRGLWSQLIALALLAGGIWAAERFGPGLEGSVAKVSSFSDAGRCVAGWGVVLVGTVVVGSVLVRLATHRLPKPAGTKLRSLGMLLGLGRGALVVAVAVYAILGWNDGTRRPAFVEDLEHARTAGWARRGVEALLEFVPVPACVAAKARLVGERIAPALPAR